jgi:flagellin
MSGIVLSSAVRQNLLALQDTAAALATTQNDLSTGKKVNSALDNPTNFFTAAGLDNRAGDISNLLDGISNGVQVIQAANTGLTSIESLVSQAKSIANQALQTSIGYSTKASVTSAAITGATSSNLLGTTTYANGSYTGTALTQADTAADPVTSATALASSTSADSIAGPTNGTNLVVNGKTISFTNTGTTTSSATGASINITSGTLGDVVNAINAITGSTTASISSGSLVIATGTTSSGVTVGGTALTALGLNAGTSTNVGTASVTSISASGTALVGTSSSPINSGETLTIPVTNDGTTTTASITFGTGSGQVSTLDELNTALASSNLQATLNSVTGELTIATTNDAASGTIGSITGSGVGTTDDVFNPATSGYSLTSSPTADATSQSARATLVAQYNAILTQIDNTASDSSYNGVNLLNGDQLQLTFNETGKSKLNITGVNFGSAGLGLAALTSSAFQDNNATNSVLATLNTASTTLRSEASALGSNLSVVQTRQDFNTNLINVLQTGSANLTQADINLEAANSQALSTRQSLSVSALSLANQSQQSVLQLLR